MGGRYDRVTGATSHGPTGILAVVSALRVEDDVDSGHGAFLDGEGRLTLPDQVLEEADLAGGDGRITVVGG